MKLSQKGWVVIPAALREKYGLKPGARIHVVDYGGVLALVPVIDPHSFHSFKIIFNEKELSIAVDDFSKTFPVENMKRVLGPGLVRFHATRSWMDITRIVLSTA